MASAQPHKRNKLIVDSVHGDIQLSDIEHRVIDTASFQRLRNLKQLGMAQVTYPNATHTRFAHSIGVLGIMQKITRVARESLHLNETDVEDICLAGLLHDIGHYPYSHLMERIDKVQLTEEFLSNDKIIRADKIPYPKHEEIGELIVTRQRDLIEALGGKERATRLAALFAGKTTDNQQLSKLIHSSLDMDRLDYLLRDAQATGVPYGQIDLNYLLHNFKASPSGMLGVKERAITAVDHFLLGRFFMHRSVYYHKTTFGLEEACRQLLRRLRDREEKYGLPADGEAIKDVARGRNLGQFTDGFVDGIVERAAQDADQVIQSLANSIRRRRPPKLLKEVSVLGQSASADHSGTLFKNNCKHQLQQLAKRYKIPVGRFLVCQTPPFTLEERGAFITDDQGRKLPPEAKDELIKVFEGDATEPTSVVNVKHSLIHVCSNYFYQAFRLYLVRDDKTDAEQIKKLKAEVARW